MNTAEAHKKKSLTITLGVTTYNRVDILEKMATSLQGTRGLDRSGVHLRVYDDCSTDFEVPYLQSLFPGATEVVRRPHNLGANGNMHQMHLDFLETGDDLLFYADADLIYHPDWLDFLLSMMPHTDGVFRVYNSAQARSLATVRLGEHDVVSKEYLGSAGVALSRDHVADIVEACPVTATFDWDWSHYLHQKGVRLLVSKRSYVQHIGMTGYNSDGSLFIDFGRWFYPGTVFNEQIMVEQNDFLLSRNDDMVRGQIEEHVSQLRGRIPYHSLAFRIGKKILSAANPVVALLKKIAPGMVAGLRRRLLR